MAGSSRRSPRRPGRRHFTDQAQGLPAANLTLHGIDAGETLESIAPIGLRRFRSRRGAGKHLTTQGQGLFAVTVGQRGTKDHAQANPWYKRYHGPSGRIFLDRPGTQGDALGLRITTLWAVLTSTPVRFAVSAPMRRCRGPARADAWHSGKAGDDGYSRDDARLLAPRGLAGEARRDRGGSQLNGSVPVRSRSVPVLDDSVPVRSHSVLLPSRSAPFLNRVAPYPC